jgi:hypothetical protein
MRDYAGLLPVLLDSDLFSAGWNGAIEPYPGISRRQYAAQHLRRSLVKKFVGEKTDTEANCKALELFKKINLACATFALDTSSMSEPEAIAIGEAKDYINRFFYKKPEGEWEDQPILTFTSIAGGFGLGNGANIGSYGTDFLSKLGTSRMSATSSELHSLYVQAISPNPTWSSVESTRSQHRVTDIVRGSRLSFVPKTTEISRTICTEPILNMLFQKGIAEVITRRLEETSGISLSRQPDKNQKLAQLGSITGEFGTIDLSSASDSMSIGVVKEFFPSYVARWLDRTRSPLTVLPDGTEVELHMVSSMGNAFTFPLQTLFFTSLVYGVYKVLDIPIKCPRRQSLGNFAVFGDDIIVVRQAYDLLCKLLRLCGFSVNVDKSFNDGLFRESCGRDFYDGYNVRGVYIKSLSDSCDTYSAINRLNVWSAKHGMPLPRTVQYLIKGHRFLPVPLDEQDIAGIKVYESHLRKKIRNKDTGGILYRYVRVDENSSSVSDVSLRPPRLRGWIDNPSAVLLAALAGTLRRGKVVTRVNAQRSTSFRKRYSSRWDYIPSEMDVSPSFGVDWKVYIELNLNLF